MEVEEARIEEVEEANMLVGETAVVVWHRLTLLLRMGGLNVSVEMALLRLLISDLLPQVCGPKYTSLLVQFGQGNTCVWPSEWRGQRYDSEILIRISRVVYEM